jgi:hypothetical protein
MPGDRLGRTQWLRTPYAGTQAQRTDQSLDRLLGRYHVQQYQWTQAKGPSGRPLIAFRFELENKCYRIAVETLNADAPAADLLLQAKRAIFHMMKSSLEMASVFAPMERVLFAYLETAHGQTVYELAAPHLGKLDHAFPKLLAGMTGGS